MAAIADNWRLPQALTAISNGSRWPDVLREWSLDHIEMLEPEEDAQTCLCTHYPIREVCHIINDENGHRAIVGNCCVTKFMGDQPVFAGTQKMFDALGRIRRDINASANESLIEHVYSKGIISEGDYNFYLDIWRKRKPLSDRQKRWKVSLNQRIITRLVPSRRPVAAARPVARPLAHAPFARPLAQAPFARPLAQAPAALLVAQAPAALPVAQAPAALPVAQAPAAMANVAMEDRAQRVQDVFAEALQNLRASPRSMAAPVLVNRAYEQKMIKQKDYDFYNSLFRRNVRHLTAGQQGWINDINQRMLRGRFN